MTATAVGVTAGQAADRERVLRVPGVRSHWRSVHVSGRRPEATAAKGRLAAVLGAEPVVGGSAGRARRGDAAGRGAQRRDGH